MIKATGTVLSIDGTPIVELDDTRLGFALAGQAYTVRRTGMLAPLYRLLRDGELAASAQQSPFVNRYTIIASGRAWRLKAENMAARRFGLFDGDARVGGIGPTGGGSEISIDLPPAVPLAAQVFLMWLLLWKWGASST